MRTRFNRGQQGKDDINRLVINCIEINGFRQARKDPDRMFDPLQLAVRDGNSMPYACRAQTLPLQEGVKNRPLIQARYGSRPARNFL